jgi:acyl carrier protein
LHENKKPYGEETQSMDELEKRVVDLIAEVLVDVNKENIQLDSKIVEDLGAESLDIYDMVALLEDEFGMEITDEEVEKIQTVQDVADFIRAHQKAS